MTRSSRGRPRKLFLAYDRPWWQEVGLNAGRSVNDLPLRQTYYWGVEGNQPGADRANRNALLLASYNDLSDVEFWNELLTRPKRLSLVAVARPPRPMGTSAPGTLVDEAQRQLRELHGPRARIPDSGLLPELGAGPVRRGLPLLAGGGEELGGHAADAPPDPRRRQLRSRATSRRR